MLLNLNYFIFIFRVVFNIQYIFSLEFKPYQFDLIILDNFGDALGCMIMLN